MITSNIVHSLRDYFTEKRVVVFTLSFILALFLIVLVLSDGFTGGAESVGHFYFSYYAVKYPHLFFNSWGRPVFTLLSAPFAIFGLKGMQLFNILAGIVAAYFSYLVAKELKMKQPVLAIILCCFASVFAYHLFSGLPEILFALVAILTTYLLLKDRFVLASIVVSFLPMIRAEGIFLLPIYAIFLVYRKQYWTILLMATGIISYSFVGYLFNHDLFWLISQNPYKGEAGVYGTGSFFQFIKRSPGYFGIPNEIFYITGLAAGITLFLRDKKMLAKELLLVVFPFLTYFLVHSFMWWSGFGNSQGLNRYMAAIVPFMAVMSTRGLTLFSLMFEIIFKRAWAKTAALLIGILSVIHIPFVVQNYPIGIDSNNKLIKQTTDWIKQNGLDKEKVYFKDVTFPYMLGARNPFDGSNMCLVGVKGSENLHNKIDVGSTLVYDERFFPIDKIAFDSLVANRHFELQKVFEPDKNVKVYGRDYRIAVFKRIEPDSTILNQNRMVAYGSKDEFRTLAFYDFERTADRADSLYIAFDDKNETKCLRVDSSKVSYLYKEFDLSTLSFEKPLELYLRLKIKTQDTLCQPLLYVLEVTKNNRQIYHNEITLQPKDKLVNNWSELECRVKLPEEISFKGTLRLYFLNRHKGEYYLDDYQVGYCYKR